MSRNLLGVCAAIALAATQAPALAQPRVLDLLSLIHI